MLIDKSLEFSDKQAVTTSAASENISKVGKADHGFSGKHVRIAVSEKFVGTGTSTLVVSLQKADIENGSDAEDIASTVAIAEADLVAGKEVFLPIPHGADGEYLRAFYTVASGPFTAGKISAAVVDSVQKSKAYPAV